MPAAAAVAESEPKAVEAAVTPVEPSPEVPSPELQPGHDSPPPEAPPR
jgi:hypothetical protein